MSEPAQETLEVFVEMAERDIYFLETILAGYDGIGHVRRDWHVRDGRRFVKILVPADFRDDVLRALENARKYVHIGEIRSSL